DEAVGSYTASRNGEGGLTVTVARTRPAQRVLSACRRIGQAEHRRYGQPTRDHPAAWSSTSAPRGSPGHNALDYASVRAYLRARSRCEFSSNVFPGRRQSRGAVVLSLEDYPDVERP